MFSIVFILLILPKFSLVFSLSSQSGFGRIYQKTIYIPLIVESRPFVVRNMITMMNCFYTCLNEYDCSLAVFFQHNRECKIYNLFPLIERELFPNDYTVVLTFERTIKLPSSISDLNWLLSRLNQTIPFRKLTIERPRCLGIDEFGYLLTLDTFNSTSFFTRYDRINLNLIKRSILPYNVSDVGVFTYHNQMLFISPRIQNFVHVYDFINFNLRSVITCGSYLSRPRDIIFVQDGHTMVLASTNNYTLFFRVNSPINYTCIQQIQLSNQPHGLAKVNETFFYMTTWLSRDIYAFQYDGNNWLTSFFVNTLSVVPSINGLDVAPTHPRMDNQGRLWIVIFNFGLIAYDKHGTLLGKWHINMVVFDIIITNDYRFIMSNRINSSLTIYDPQLCQ